LVDFRGALVRLASRFFGSRRANVAKVVTCFHWCCHSFAMHRDNGTIFGMGDWRFRPLVSVSRIRW
jgi:hypothetical protein